MRAKKHKEMKPAVSIRGGIKKGKKQKTKTAVVRRDSQRIDSITAVRLFIVYCYELQVTSIIVVSSKVVCTFAVCTGYYCTVVLTVR